MSGRQPVAAAIWRGRYGHHVSPRVIAGRAETPRRTEGENTAGSIGQPIALPAHRRSYSDDMRAYVPSDQRPEQFGVTERKDPPIGGSQPVPA
jgi:hypothetical protein